MENSKKELGEVDLYLFVLDLLKQGKTPAKISKEYDISKQKIYYYTTKLKKEGMIRKKSNGLWEVSKNYTAHSNQIKKKFIRGHAFIWKVKIPKELGKKWIEILKRKGVDYKLQKNNTIRAFINKRKIWFGKESIIIYEPHSFYGENAIQSRKYAVISLLETLQVLSNKIGIDLRKYGFKPSREHYGLIKNELAQQLNKNKEKLFVRDDVDGEWLWVDDSEGQLGEFETGGKGISQDRAGLNMKVQNFWNDHKKHKFAVTPSFVIESLNKLTEVQLREQTLKAEYAKDLVEHKKAIVKMGANTEANSISTELLANTVLELKEAVKDIHNGLTEEIISLRKEVSQLKGNTNL